MAANIEFTPSFFLFFFFSLSFSFNFLLIYKDQIQMPMAITLWDPSPGGGSFYLLESVYKSNIFFSFPTLILKFYIANPRWRQENFVLRQQADF